jgi:hypothetical protein
MDPSGSAVAAVPLCCRALVANKVGLMCGNRSALQSGLLALIILGRVDKSQASLAL